MIIPNPAFNTLKINQVIAAAPKKMPKTIPKVMI